MWKYRVSRLHTRREGYAYEKRESIGLLLRKAFSL